MPTAIVTGSGGLIGSESVARFVELGLDVLGLENDMRASFFGLDASTGRTTDSLLARYPEAFRSLAIDIRDREAVERAHLTVVSRPGDDEQAVLHLRAEPGGDRLGELALGSVGADGAPVHLNLHALRDGDGFPADP